MNLSQLEALIVAQNGTVTVTGTALSSTSIDSLLTTFFNNATLVITAANVISTSDTVVITGQSTLLNLSVPVTATFYVLNGIAQITLFLTTPLTSWTFNESFSSVEDSLLQQNPFTAVQWTLESAATTDNAAGFTFTAQWVPPAVLGAIDWLIGAPQTLSVVGSLTLVGGLPQVSFQLGSPFDTALGNIDVSVQFLLITTVYAGKTTSLPYVCVMSFGLGASLSYQSGNNTVDVPICAFFTTNLSIISFSANTAQALTIPIDQIASWIGGSDLTSAGNIPSNVSTDDLQIQSLSITISIPSKSIVGISITLAVTGEWEIVPNVLLLGNLALNVYVSNPFGASRQFMNVISAQLDIDISGAAPVTIDVAAELPNFIIQGALPDGNTTLPSLAGYMAGGHGVGASAGFTEELTIQSLLFLADPSASLYRFQINVSDNWQLTPSLSLVDLGVMVLYASGSLSGSLVAGFILGSTYIMLDASYDGSSGGWQLSGETGPGQSIAIGDLIADIGTSFGFTPSSLPDSLTGLTISNIAFQLNTQSLDFNLDLDAQMPVNGTSADAVVSIAYTQTQAGVYQAEFSGVVTIDGQSFALIFSEVSGS